MSSPATPLVPGRLPGVQPTHLADGHPHLPIVVPPPHNDPHPNNHLFPLALLHKVMRSAPYAWPLTHTTQETAKSTCCGTAPKPGAEKTRKGDSSPQLAQHYAATGTTVKDAPPALTNIATNVQDAETKITELRNALELRKRRALTPYKVDKWTPNVTYLSNTPTFLKPYYMALTQDSNHLQNIHPQQ